MIDNFISAACNKKALRCVGVCLRFVVLVASIPVLSSCNRDEVRRLTSERDGLQAKLARTEAERDELVQASNSLYIAEIAKGREIQSTQVELSKASNVFQLERSALLLTNNFFAAEIERLKSELSKLSTAIAEDRQRAKESAKREPILNGIKALKKLTSATTVGVNKRDYSQQLIESDEAVRSAISASKGELASALEAAWNAFSDANVLWQKCISGVHEPYFGRTMISQEYDSEAYLLCVKYGIGDSTKETIYTDTTGVSTIWAKAKEYLKQAEDLSAKETENP